MTVTRSFLVLALLGLAGAPASAQLRRQSNYVAVRTPSILDSVAVVHRDAVAKVMKSPTITTKATEDPFAASSAVYSWMLDNPDRVCFAWQRLDVPCVEIAALGNRRFAWTDEQGSKLTWEPVAKLADGVVWYATGQVKAAALLPMVPVKAVAVLRYPGVKTTKAGISNLKPEIEIYFQTDSRAASALLRMMGPAGPRLAEYAAGQLLYFFSGIAVYLEKQPEKATVLLAEKRK